MSTEEPVTARLYKVDTHVVVVDVSLGCKPSLHGVMFLRPSILTATGVESIADRLNDRDAFFPLRIGAEADHTEVIGKAQVRYVTTDNQPAPERTVTGLGTEIAEFTLTLELDTGEELTGMSHALLPKAKRRFLDFANAPHAGPYVTLCQGGRIYVVNRPFIRRLRELSGP